MSNERKATEKSFPAWETIEEIRKEFSRYGRGGYPLFFKFDAGGHIVYFEFKNVMETRGAIVVELVNIVPDKSLVAKREQ